MYSNPICRHHIFTSSVQTAKLTKLYSAAITASPTMQVPGFIFSSLATHTRRPRHPVISLCLCTRVISLPCTVTYRPIAACLQRTRAPRYYFQPQLPDTSLFKRPPVTARRKRRQRNVESRQAPHDDPSSSTPSKTTFATDSSSPSSSNSPSPPPPPSPPRAAAARSVISSSLLGRAVVELCALGIGALLLLLVVCWRFLRWVGNVGRLGKWAWSRSHDVGMALITAPAVVASAVHNALFDPDRKGASRTNKVGTSSNDVVVRSASVPESDLVSKAEFMNVQNELYRVRTMLENNDLNSYSESSTKTALPSPESSNTESSSAVHRFNVSVSKSQVRRRLVLMRHAKSSWDRTGEVSDFDRKLSPRGCAEATVMGMELQRRGWLTANIVCSSSVRTVETLRILRTSTQLDQEEVKPTIVESLYFAVSSNEMAAAVEEAALTHPVNGSAESLLCICHNPGCESLIEYLTGEKHHMGTACAALLEELPVDEGEGNLEERDPSSARNAWSLMSQAGRFRIVDLLRPDGLLD